jgi:hypothetical protein
MPDALFPQRSQVVRNRVHGVRGTDFPIAWQGGLRVGNMEKMICVERKENQQMPSALAMQVSRK